MSKLSCFPIISRRFKYLTSSSDTVYLLNFSIQKNLVTSHAYSFPYPGKKYRYFTSGFHKKKIVIFTQSVVTFWTEMEQCNNSGFTKLYIFSFLIWLSFHIFLTKILKYFLDFKIKKNWESKHKQNCCPNFCWNHGINFKFLQLEKKRMTRLFKQILLWNSCKFQSWSSVLFNQKNNFLKLFTTHWGVA